MPIAYSLHCCLIHYDHDLASKILSFFTVTSILFLLVRYELKPGAVPCFVQGVPLADQFAQQVAHDDSYRTVAEGTPLLCPLAFN